MKLIDKDAALAEIGKRIIDAPINYIGHQRVWAYNDVKDILETLEVKELQEEHISEELEEASKEWLAPQLDKSYAAYGETKQMEFTHFDGFDMIDAIEFGAKWKEQQFEKDYTNLCNGVATAKGLAVAMAYDKGMADAREQMMAKAIEGGCFSYKNGFVHISCDIDEHLTDIKMGDKVKVIVIKEDVK